MSDKTKQKNKLKTAQASIDYNNKSAVLYFYSDVDYWSVWDFISDFKYIESCGIKDVVVRINSVGGSVHDGMSVYNMILNSKMNVTTINDSVAMSMGSIIWSAGDVLKMRDVAILMIHKPFVSGLDESDMDASTKAYIKSMEHQLRMIYSKRFNMSDDEVDQIMSGEGDVDGTYFTADEAVNAGFLKRSNIIETPSSVKDEYSDILSIENKNKYAKAIASIDFSEKISKKQPKGKEDAIINKSKTQISLIMDEQLKVIASNLGISESEANLKEVTSKIVALNKLELENGALKAKVTEKDNEVKALKAKVTEKEAELLASNTNGENLTQSLNEVKAELERYKEAETARQNEKVNDLINKAIEEGRIKEESKAIFVEMASSNFEKAKQLIDGITPSLTPISQEIAENRGNVEDAKSDTGADLEACNKRNEEILAEKIKQRNLRK